MVLNCNSVGVLRSCGWRLSFVRQVTFSGICMEVWSNLPVEIWSTIWLLSTKFGRFWVFWLDLVPISGPFLVEFGANCFWQISFLIELGANYFLTYFDWIWYQFLAHFWLNLKLIFGWFQSDLVQVFGSFLVELGAKFLANLCWIWFQFLAYIWLDFWWIFFLVWFSPNFESV